MKILPDEGSVETMDYDGNQSVRIIEELDEKIKIVTKNELSENYKLRCEPKL